MSTAFVSALATAAALGAAPMVTAGVINVTWDRSSAPAGQAAWDLYASVTADTLTLNADLGDQAIDEPPDGIDTGLYSIGGTMLAGSFVTLGGANISFARDLTITPSGAGSLADAAWFFALGVAPEMDGQGGYRIRLGRFFVDEGTGLGGALGGPGGDLQSRIFIGWEDDAGAGVGVFNIPFVPAPGAAALLALTVLGCRQRRRRMKPA